MSREFKFRVWDVELKQFYNKRYDNELFINPLTGKIHEFHNHFDSCEEKKGFVIQQFMGCLDKNGKEICEGDIVTFGGFTGEIKYGGPDYLIKLHNRSECIYLGLPKYLEVIGNIFENPELLNGETE